MLFLPAAVAASILVAAVLAHPGDDHSHEIAERAAFTKLSKKDLSHCAEKFKESGLEQRAIARRAATAQKSRQKRGLSTTAPFLRTRAGPLDTDHHSSVNYSSDTDSSSLFASNGSCILSPEVTLGPYWVGGEYVRENVSEDQAGLSLILDAQVLDISTCDPVTNAVLEIWSCNSTGVYSGVVARGNGVGTADPSNLDNTFMRGLQRSDADGVAQFTTLFPGHYTGRATHIHVLVHFNGTSFENGTYAGGYVSHVGQLYFDQDLISEVEATGVYTTNTQALTTNADDSILSTGVANGHDPFVEYSYLGNSVEDGIFAWISFGVDLTSQRTLTGAATLTENGGVANTGNGGGGGGGSSGSAPSGNPTSNGAGNGGNSGSTGGGVSSFVPSATSSLMGVLSAGLVFLLFF
ncbi:Intradiol ring-cleavage dioxygenase [Rhexocercosporidium sp. MPI-PUGE-AT-0058]|nr:Intradiol ring-cleavage dioxygenase [Rhexocercosporidium sp. MPI-PUGE-AT-0058]